MFDTSFGTVFWPPTYPTPLPQNLDGVENREVRLCVLSSQDVCILDDIYRLVECSIHPVCVKRRSFRHCVASHPTRVGLQTAWQFEVRRVNTGIQFRDLDLSWPSISTVVWLLVAMSGAYSTWTASHCQLSVIK